VMGVTPTPLLAKGHTDKIIIEGAGIPAPVEITDSKILANFNVWTGPGTSSNEKEGFIIQWSQGAAEPPPGLPRYQVSFYTDESGDRLSYVVFYSYDPSAKLGYVYLPGPGEKWSQLNMGSIYHGVEGHWFHAWQKWDATVVPSILPVSDSSGLPFSRCSAHDFPAHLVPTDPVYANALELERKLSVNGVAVQCICESKMQSFFPGQTGAAFYRTASGSFDALFFPQNESPASIEVVERQDNGRFLYSFRGAGSAPEVDSSRPEHFIRSANVLLVVWGDNRLASILESKFPQSNSPQQ
jgi:hypothetical protein